MSTYEKALDAGFWQRVRTDGAYAAHREELLKNWEQYGTAPITDIRYRDFKRFYQDGDRQVYQKHYFARRHGMNTAALLALIYPEEPEYLTRLMDHIFAICNEYSWVLPAHQKALESYNPVHIDLFAAETAVNLAETWVLLKDRLDPFILRRMEEELRRRILEPYRGRTFKWETAATNWTAVCTCGAAIALMNLFPEEAKALIPRFEAAMDSFLSGYGEDGFCLEGPMYWYYGFGFFTAYAERLRDFSGIDRFRDPKVRRIASFFQKKYLSGSAGVTFADADMGTAYSVGIQHFLRREYPEDVVIPPAGFGCFTDGMARFCLHLRSFIWFDPAAECEERPAVYYGENAQWLIVRKDGFGFAAKAGHNDEPHNHNDVGSFIFAKNGRQVLTDPGRGEYCRDYFREKRYEFLHTSSRGHSLPIVDGQLQKNGPQYRAGDVCWDGRRFSMELAGAYDLPQLRSLRREFTIKEDGVILKDCFDCDGVITERFAAFQEPQVSPGVLDFGDARLTFEPGCCTVGVSRVESVVEYGRKQVLYLIDLTLLPGADGFACSIQ